MALSMRLATWNILAPEFCAPPREGGRDYYARVRSELSWDKRMPRIITVLGEIAADVVCLQEVSQMHWSRGLKASLEELGYTCLYAPRPDGRPDGVALLSRGEWRPVAHGVGSFDDGSEKVWLWATLEGPEGRAHVASVHLKWDASGTIPMTQLARVLDDLGGAGGEPVVVAGDLNADPLRLRAWPFVGPGWSVAHPDDGRPTWFADGRAEKTDAILWRNWSSVRFEPYPDVPVDPGLPSAQMPSDHLPLIAELH
jgi:endonuclease/exonuclease/phosphatase family metal-dependent hydrolase